MKTWTQYLHAKITRRVLVPVLAAGLVTSAAIYHFAYPTRAVAAAPAPAAAALDDNSVSALVALDHAMETLAARVTPAIVNVTVTSKTMPGHGGAADRGNDGDDDNDGGLQQFFGPSVLSEGSLAASSAPCSLSRALSTAWAAVSSSRPMATSSPTITSSTARWTSM